jgi:hypothetical protein
MMYKIELHPSERVDVDCIGCPNLIMKHRGLFSQENSVASHAAPDEKRKCVMADVLM